MAVVIYPQTLDWDYMKQRPQHLMTQLGRLGHTVFFINQKSSRNQYEEVSENVFVVTDTKDLIARKLQQLRKIHKVVIWTTWPKLWKKIEDFQPDRIIYDCCDEFPQWARYERRMIQNADVIVCSAKTIFTRLNMRYPEKPIHLIRNGVDVSFFRNTPDERPSDLPTGKPIVGYVGAWAYWVDHDLMDKICNTFTDVNFVIIGVPYGEVPAYGHENVFFLGAKPHEDLPKYLRHFDIGIVPFQYHPITLATNPIKVYEYLSVGLTTLSTALPECIAMEPHITTATSHDDFIKKLEFLLKRIPSTKEIESRIQFARQNTWNKIGYLVHNIIQQTLRKK